MKFARVLLGILFLVPFSSAVESEETNAIYSILNADILINADMWSEQPQILAAGLGFTEIIGVPNLSTNQPAVSETLTRLAGGTWNTPTCANEDTGLYAHTSAATPGAIRPLYGKAVYFADGLPVEFSWPVLPSSVSPQNFRITLNNGVSVYPEVASIWPNFEYNERSTVVLFGYFGNRMSDQEEGAIYPVSLEIVEGESSLVLVGPAQFLFDATGLSIEMPGSPYSSEQPIPSQRKGPTLIAAKLSRYESLGDTGPVIFRNGLLPNHGEALYGPAAQWRLRVLTTGGMTFDGVRGLHPDEFAEYFRIEAKDANGQIVHLDQVGKDYVFSDGSQLRVEGLADLGLADPTYDDCYQEDKDNQIDIILSGDLKAADKISRVEIPSVGRYRPLYNPGGPGSDPSPNVRYTDPTPPIAIDVLNALRDPMTVNYLLGKRSYSRVLERILRRTRDKEIREKRIERLLRRMYRRQQIR